MEMWRIDSLMGTQKEIMTRSAEDGFSSLQDAAGSWSPVRKRHKDHPTLRL